METGKLENWQDVREVVLMCIGTDKGRWWADPEFGSELWKLRQNGKLTGKTVGTFRQMVLDCLQWLINDGLALRIECTAEQSGINMIAYCVTVMLSGGNSIKVEDNWNGV